LGNGQAGFFVRKFRHGRAQQDAAGRSGKIKNRADLDPIFTLCFASLFRWLVEKTVELRFVGISVAI